MSMILDVVFLVALIGVMFTGIYVAHKLNGDTKFLSRLVLLSPVLASCGILIEMLVNVTPVTLAGALLSCSVLSLYVALAFELKGISLIRIFCPTRTE